MARWRSAVMAKLIFKLWWSTTTLMRLLVVVDAHGKPDAVNRRDRQASHGLEPWCSGLDPLLRGFGTPRNWHGGLEPQPTMSVCKHCLSLQ